MMKNHRNIFLLFIRWAKSIIRPTLPPPFRRRQLIMSNVNLPVSLFAEYQIFHVHAHIQTFFSIAMGTLCSNVNTVQWIHRQPAHLMVFAVFNIQPTTLHSFTFCHWFYNFNILVIWWWRRWGRWWWWVLTLWQNWQPISSLSFLYIPTFLNIFSLWDSPPRHSLEQPETGREFERRCIIYKLKLLKWHQFDV